MKVVKNILMGMVVLGIVVLAFKILDDNYKYGMEICTKAGNSVQYCEAQMD